MGIGRHEAAIINFIPSLPIHSSVLFALIAGLFLAALIIRARRLPSRSSENTRRRASMSAKTSGGSASAAPSADGPASPEFTVHWGRTAVALIGVLGLATAIVSALLLTVTPVSPLIPLVGTAVFLVSLVALRSLAVLRRRRRRRQHLETALREAMNPDVEAAGLRPPSVPATSASLTGDQTHRQDEGAEPAHGAPFDALTSDDHGVGGPRSLQAVDVDGLPVDLAETFPADQGLVTAEVTAASPAEPWEPREVPRPKYLDAEKVERAVPEPITPETPRPSGEVKIGQSSESPAVAPPAPQPSKPQTAVQQSLDLDAVLKRRRA